MYIYEGEVGADFFKELTHIVMKAGVPKFGRVGQQPGDPERADIMIPVQKPPVSEFPVGQRKFIFFLVKTSTDLVSPTSL